MGSFTMNLFHRVKLLTTHHHHLWLYSPSGPWPPLIRFLNHILRHTVGLPGRAISSSQGLYLHRPRTNIHAPSGNRTHDPAYECSRPMPQTARPLGRHKPLTTTFINLFYSIYEMLQVSNNYKNCTLLISCCIMTMHTLKLPSPHNNVWRRTTQHIQNGITSWKCVNINSPASIGLKMKTF
jgi:hypothetical protein